MIWFLIDFLCGFILGIILLSFYTKMKSFMSYNIMYFIVNLFSLQKHSVIEREKFYSTDLSKTWMYELDEEYYNTQKFSYSKAKICLIEIQKNILYVFQPLKEPNRKLNDKELYSKVRFNQVRIYNLNEAIVGLLPIKIQRSKYWSKKAPIVLRNVRYLRSEFLTNSSDKTNENHIKETLFLFARTRRSKEEWFYRFVHASQLDLWRNEIEYQLEHSTKQMSEIKSSARKNIITEMDEDQRHKQRMMKFFKRSDRFTTLDNYREDSSNLLQKKRQNNKDIPSLSHRKLVYCERWLREQNHMDINEVISDNFKISQSNCDVNTTYQATEIDQSSYYKDLNLCQNTNHSLLYFVFKYLQQIPLNKTDNNIENPMLLFNIFLTRCCLDLFDNEKYLERIQFFLQKQLQKIRYSWIEHILITNLNLGDHLPEIQDIFKPWIDEHGFWSHIKISYNGKLQLTLNIKLKWIRKNRLTDQSSSKTMRLSIPSKQIQKKSWHKRLWPPSKWFQHHSSISKHSLPKKTLSTTKITRMTLVIKLEVNHLHGILLCNIPPVPSDRLWVSFLDMPAMKFSAIPHLGQHRVPFYKIKNKLEDKLRQTFRRYLVMPHMKDLIIPTAQNYLQENDFISNTQETNL